MASNCSQDKKVAFSAWKGQAGVRVRLGMHDTRRTVTHAHASPAQSTFWERGRACEVTASLICGVGLNGGEAGISAAFKPAVAGCSTSRLITAQQIVTNLFLSGGLHSTPKRRLRGAPCVHQSAAHAEWQHLPSENNPQNTREYEGLPPRICHKLIRRSACADTDRLQRAQKGPCMHP